MGDEKVVVATVVGEERVVKNNSVGQGVGDQLLGTVPSEATALMQVVRWLCCYDMILF